MPRLPSMLALWLVLACCPAATRAASSYDNCVGYVDSVPAVITTQGVWCLRKDLASALASGDLITIATNNVTLDCNDFKLGGLAAGSATATQGIRAQDRLNIGVRNCNLRGFRVGIALTGNGGGHAIERNRLDGNTQHGLVVQGDGSVIEHNRVFDTGGSTATFPNDTIEAWGIHAIGNIDVIGNLVDGVTGAPGLEGYPNGIRIEDSLGGLVADNRVRAVLRTGGGQATGLAIRPGADVVVARNSLYADAAGTSFGIFCSDGLGIVRDNSLKGFGTALVGCPAQASNLVQP